MGYGTAEAPHVVLHFQVAEEAQTMGSMGFELKNIGRSLDPTFLRF